MYVYNEINGDIIAIIPDNQSLEIFAYHYSDEIKRHLKTLSLSIEIDNIAEYKIVGGNLVKMSNQELEEIATYGKVLAEEERFLEQLKPSYEEIKKAETTIDILSILMEVL